MLHGKGCGLEFWSLFCAYFFIIMKCEVFSVLQNALSSYIFLTIATYNAEILNKIILSPSPIVPMPEGGQLPEKTLYYPRTSYTN